MDCFHKYENVFCKLKIESGAVESFLIFHNTNFSVCGNNPQCIFVSRAQHNYYYNLLFNCFLKLVVCLRFVK